MRPISSSVSVVKLCAPYHGKPNLKPTVPGASNLPSGGDTEAAFLNDPQTTRL